MESGSSVGEDWLITFQKRLRAQLPEGQYIITHARESIKRDGDMYEYLKLILAQPLHHGECLSPPALHSTNILRYPTGFHQILRGQLEHISRLIKRLEA